MKKRSLLSSIMMIVLSFVLISGATFALFTSESKTSITVQSGKVEVESTVSDLKTYSLDVEQAAGKFENGGSATLDAEKGTVVLTNITPGDKATFKLVVKNNSNVVIKYCVKYSVVGELAKGLVITETENGTTSNVVSQLSPEWTSVSAEGVLHEKLITIELPLEAGNAYQEKEASVEITVYAVQGNDLTWAGEADTTWYNATDTEFVIDTPAELQGLSQLVAAGNTFIGKTVKLGADIDLATTYNLYELNPIGNSSYAFQGTFDGAGHVISNLKLTNNPNKSFVGLFGNTNTGEIKNVIVENAEVKGYLYVGVVSGNPYTSKYTNIQVKGLVKVDGMSYVGGVGGKNAYANWDQITVDVEEGSYVKAVSTENGTKYRTYVGGVIGFMGEGGHTVSNVKSNIDVFGDVCDAGGIVGIAHYGNNFVNIECSGNVTLANPSSAAKDGLEIGGIAGVWMNSQDKITLSNCVFTGKLSSTYVEDGKTVEVTNFLYDGLVGKAYSANGTGILVIDNKEYVTKSASTAADVKNLLAAANNSGQGVEIDCGGANIGAFSNMSLYDGAVIKNAVLSGSNRWNYPHGNVTFINCTFESSVYALNVDGGDGELHFINCTFKGWSGIGSAIDKVTFENCEFYGSGTYGIIRVYQDAEFTNCKFDLSNTYPNDIYHDGLSAVNGAVVNLNNCTFVNCNYEVAEGAKILVDGVVVAED